MANTRKKQDLKIKNPLPNKKGRINMPDNVFVYMSIIFIVYLLVSAAFSAAPTLEEVPLSTAIKNISEHKVENITVKGNEIEVTLKDGTKFVSMKEPSASFSQILADNNLDVSYIAGNYEIDEPISWENIITPILMFGLPIVVLFIIFRQFNRSNTDLLSFTRSRAKLFNRNVPKITFKDVAGNEEAKTEMLEIVDFLKNSEKYRKLGVRIPKGILLVGPAGVGKTLLAKAIAGQANVPFFSVAGSEFMEMLVGVGSARARDLFRMAKESQPSIIFIDEIDAIGRQRGMGIGGGHDEREQTLNQILIEMDGFDERTDVIVLAATNRPDMLDPALIRAGRFDRTVSIPHPDLKDREAIIQIHMRGKPVAEDVSIERIARKTVGFSGADIENMLNEAAILAARGGKSLVDASDIEEAALKVTMGSERKTLQTEEERRLTAYHEAGHALVASNVPDMDPVYRVSIVARGGSLGHTSFPPERDRYNETKTRLNSLISTMLGGRVAEELVFKEQTIGASDDIDKATKLARRMVASYGMSPLGPVSFDGKAEPSGHWLAREMGEPSYSQDMAAKIDMEINKIIEDAYNKACTILRDNRDKLDRVSRALLEKETIDKEEYEELIK